MAVTLNVALLATRPVGNVALVAVSYLPALVVDFNMVAAVPLLLVLFDELLSEISPASLPIYIFDALPYHTCYHLPLLPLFCHVSTMPPSGILSP